MIMYNTPHEEQFDVIDLDPYGSMVPFIHATLRSMKNGGLLAVTCTDSRVLCGCDKHKCFYLYRSARCGNDMVHETGLRIALQTLNSVAAMMGKNIKVLLSIQSEFYIRLFVQVVRGKQESAKSIEQNGMQFYCETCCYQYYHVFGKKKENGHYQVNRFQLPESKCTNCDNEFQLSKLIRWTNVDRPAL